MKSIDLEMLLKGENLGYGDSIRLHCPFCKNEDKSFSLYRGDLGLTYICFHNSCNTFKNLDNKSNGNIPKLNKLQVYNEILTSIPTNKLWYLFKKFYLTPYTIRLYNIKYNLKRNTIVYTIYNQFKLQVGFIDRDYFTNRVPKSLVYWTKISEMKLAWAKNAQEGIPSTILICEDIVSAIRAAKYVDSVALLGTHLSEEQILYLHKDYDNIILALDNDAQLTALRYKRLYQSLFKSWYNFNSVLDIKNMSDKILNYYLNLYMKKRGI